MVHKGNFIDIATKISTTSGGFLKPRNILILISGILISSVDSFHFSDDSSNCKASDLNVC